MTTELVEKNVLRKDHDGQWYSLPTKMVDPFIQANEDIMNADFMSTDWSAAVNELSDQFGQYLKD
jgi:hypothetical protein